MLFNSYVFLFLFLPLVPLGWWSIPNRNWRLGFLALASYVFYGWWNWRFVPLMLVSSSADFVAAQLIVRARSQAAKTTYLVLLLTINLGLLATFKYYDFFANSFNWLSQQGGTNLRVPLLHLTLPVGISFYTFNSISYTLDVYRSRVRPTRNLIEFSAFVAMFPHLVAGPIVRYADMADQFAHIPKRPRYDELAVGLWLITIGMVKKVLVADVVSRAVVTPLFPDPGHLQTIGGWLAAVAFAVQIYFDFSGYSDMAVGLACLLGLRYPQNFHSPYQATNIGAFWRRWHMSLSFWLRDYLYIPLGGSRGTKLQTARNLFVTMLLGGLWHGAAWTFVVWGLYHGVLLAGHATLKNRGWVPRSRGVAIGATFLAVVVGWVFFRADSLSDAWQMLTAMAGTRGLESVAALLHRLDVVKLLWLAGALAIAFLAPNTWEIRYPRTWWGAVACALALFMCALRFASPSPFLYFQF